jgi:hypothetical protein
MWCQRRRWPVPHDIVGTGLNRFADNADPIIVIARLDRAIQYPQASGYWIARSGRAMTA